MKRKGRKSMKGSVGKEREKSGSECDRRGGSESGSYLSRVWLEFASQVARFSARGGSK